MLSANKPDQTNLNVETPANHIPDVRKRGNTPRIYKKEGSMGVLVNIDDTGVKVIEVVASELAYINHMV